MTFVNYDDIEIQDAIIVFLYITCKYKIKYKILKMTIKINLIIYCILIIYNVLPMVLIIYID